MKTIITTILILTAVFLSKDVFADMTPVWVKSYNSPGNLDDRGENVLNDGSGNVYVSGQSSTSGNFEIFITKYNPAGTVQWTKTYTHPDGALILKMALDGSGNVYIAGIAGSNILIAKYNSSGTFQWAKTPFYANWASAQDVYVSSEGNVYVVGNISNSGTSAIIIKYNSSGVKQWEDIRTMNGNSHASNVKMDANGNIYSIGVSEMNNTKKTITVMKYNNNGLIMGIFQVDDPLLQGSQYVTIAEIDNNNNIYVSSETFFTDNLTKSDIWTVKINSSLQLVWSKRYNGLTNNNDSPRDMHVDGNGSVYVVGQTWTSGLSRQDFVTIKYVSTGSMQWDAIHNGSASDTDYAAGVVVDQLGNVYVTGRVKTNSTGYDITTIKYGILGAKQWETSFSGSEVDQPAGISIDNTGNLYVVGTAKRFLNDDLDMVLLKYISTVGIQQISGEVPSEFTLSQNYPNPFNPVTNIKFSIPKQGNVKLVVFDISGREVAELVNENLSAGIYNYDFNASHLSSGAYFYKLVSNEFTEVKKMILVK